MTDSKLITIRAAAHFPPRNVSNLNSLHQMQKICLPWRTQDHETRPLSYMKDTRESIWAHLARWVCGLPPGVIMCPAVFHRFRISDHVCVDQHHHLRERHTTSVYGIPQCMVYLEYALFKKLFHFTEDISFYIVSLNLYYYPHGGHNYK